MAAGLNLVVGPVATGAGLVAEQQRLPVETLAQLTNQLIDGRWFVGDLAAELGSLASGLGDCHRDTRLVHVQADISGVDVAGSTNPLGNSALDNRLLSCVRLFHDLPPSIVALCFGAHLNITHDVEVGQVNP
ncbi:hypothetical protein QEJ81_10500 [Halomonas icarae]|nr:hypothetical protein [Halomonas icarae]MDR5902532.1 hypothetical protein [Halomonas icarae]